jgi:hypothetical protein
MLSRSFSFARQAMAKAALPAALVAGAAGCYTDKPHGYGQERPSVYDIDNRDRGLQSKEVNESADQMAADLLSLPALNRSREQWTIVTTPVDDQTLDRHGRANYNIFIQALQDRLARQSEGRVTLIANRNDFYKKRSDELEGGGRDEFGQTGGDTPGAGDAISPDYSLDGVVMDMPNRGTNYYQIQFRLTNLRNRTIPWNRVYSVKVAR